MSKTNKKQTFLGGAAILTLSAIIVKIIGFLYKMPIQGQIGEDGYSYFSSAYQIYDVLLMIATTGLPVAMSRMISEASALENDRQITQIHRVSRRVFLVIGVTGTLLMALGCKLWARVLGQPNAWFSILCLSPAVLFICLTSASRGFFQGQSNMTPTSVSQIIEALCKLIFGLGFAVVIMALFRRSGLVVGNPEDLTPTQEAELSIAHSWAAGGAILGVSIGSALAALYLWFNVRKARGESPLRGREKSGRATAKELLLIALPITLGSAGLQLITLLDSIVYMWRLKTAAGFTQLEADRLKGIYTYCQTIFNMPCAFVTPIVISAIPALTEQITVKDKNRERSIMESALRVMGLIAFPCGIGLTVLAGPIYQLLARATTAQSLQTAAPSLAILGLCVIFNCIVLVTNGIMQSHGNVTIPVIHMLVGGVIKVITNYFLVGNPAINIVGVPMGTLLCYIVIACLNLFAMRRLGYGAHIGRTMVKPMLASVLMGAVAWLARRVLAGMGLGNLLVVAGSILAAGVVYVILVLVLRVITREDCSLLPKGDKIAALLKIR